MSMGESRDDRGVMWYAVIPFGGLITIVLAIVIYLLIWCKRQGRKGAEHRGAVDYMIATRGWIPLSRCTRRVWRCPLHTMGLIVKGYEIMVG